MKKVIGIATAAVFFLIAFSSAQAQQQSCGPREKVLEHLAQKYGEQPIAAGIMQGGQAVLEILASQDGSTFTVIISLPNGVSCVKADGVSFQQLEPLYAESGA
ncbi:MAG TPA: hypothetical protein DD397_06695 [Hyphomonas sp.]|jgi:pyruvate/2-oxoglutarate dehydrogenase complex dihydrolipoamide acyltransferase (E2) component|uniref:hypothetical protein n=1 Tax=Hyphomonas sp. TaxID=87 RepID=UPI000E817109|nr:hypothetical protein [Hyphomonas sp.]QDP49098.1 MAG: hypothetical protein Unbinned4811contig1001_43 [Prokaryotic dsDNA virus sp.]HBN92234.1 hypothetical protein [Hyphomonas sp.]|tara:strand:+ start:561 stop:869 length:309 start_codon:yes stop_codon:yes gene_type:complete